jgi:hypothetical protein
MRPPLSFLPRQTTVGRSIISVHVRPFYGDEIVASQNTFSDARKRIALGDTDDVPRLARRPLSTTRTMPNEALRVCSAISRPAHSHFFVLPNGGAIAAQVGDKTIVVGATSRSSGRPSGFASSRARPTKR